jgi:hypothetical protein
MAATKPIPLRLSVDILHRLDVASKIVGNNRAGLIRFLIESWLSEFEKKGKTIMPPNWEEILLAMDHRTKESKASSFSPSHTANKTVKPILPDDPELDGQTPKNEGKQPGEPDDRVPSRSQSSRARRRLS